MRVVDIMTRNPVSISAQDSLRVALEIMDQMEFHHLPVLSQNGHLVGVITARECRVALRLPDIVREYWHDHDAIDTLKVRDVMSTTLIIAEPTMAAEEAARLMLTHYVTCLPVMREETLVGIVTVSDILVAFVGTRDKEQSLTPR